MNIYKLKTVTSGETLYIMCMDIEGLPIWLSPPPPFEEKKQQHNLAPLEWWKYSSQMWTISVQIRQFRFSTELLANGSV